MLKDGWDKKFIEMLNNCEAGQKAVITGNSTYYLNYDNMFLFENVLLASAMDYWDEETNLPVFMSRHIN